MFETRPDRDAEVALLGRSNVGKSTLMREITGHTFDTGGKPGVTREPNHYDWAPEDFVVTDLPGFGFMEGVPEGRREAIKTDIVRYVEAHADAILVGVIVLDGKAAVDIIDRHSGPDEIPHAVELFSFLQEVGIPPVLAVNKMDKVDDRDERL
ncbi:MAG: GTP-binding protein EngB, partial [Haloglomus sp.]